MKRSLFAFAAVAITLLGTSCEKNEFLTPAEQSNTEEISQYGRGGIGDETGGTCINPVTTRLIIEKDGQNNDYDIWVGNVTVVNDQDSITITYDCINGNVLKEVRVWAGLYDDAPVNNAGHPKNGWFMAVDNNISNLPNYSIKVPTSSIGVGNNGIIMAHAKVFKHNSESSWGEGPQFKPGKGKARYINYQACSGGGDN